MWPAGHRHGLFCCCLQSATVEYSVSPPRRAADTYGRDEIVVLQLLEIVPDGPLSLRVIYSLTIPRIEVTRRNLAMFLDDVVPVYDSRMNTRGNSTMGGSTR